MQMTRTTIVRKVAAIAAALVGLTVAFVAGTGSAATADRTPCCSDGNVLSSATRGRVAGQAQTGVGVLLASTSDTALKVGRKAQFSRRGLVPITYPAKSTVVSRVPRTAKSLVMAT